MGRSPRPAAGVRERAGPAHARRRPGIPTHGVGLDHVCERGTFEHVAVWNVGRAIPMPMRPILLYWVVKAQAVSKAWPFMLPVRRATYSVCG